MFQESRPLFQDTFEQAKIGTVYCITRYREGANLGPQMRGIIKWAGVEVWPKTFQNCRSARETELFKLAGGNVKAVCSWIGNSPAVAMRHYAQVIEADMKEATKFSVMDDDRKAVHNPVQNIAESSGIESHERRIPVVVTPCQCETNHQKTTACDSMQNAGQWAGLDSNQRRLTPAGLQPAPFSRSGTDPQVSCVEFHALLQEAE